MRAFPGGTRFGSATPCPHARGLRPRTASPTSETIEWDTSADGYRLPTEAEWEHACRAGSTGPRYGQLDEIAWYRGNSDEQIHEVGGKRPNAWGLYDMLGNVWDWCWDIYDAEVYGTYRVLRGGGWFDEHWSCRASARAPQPPDLADRRRGVPRRPFHTGLIPATPGNLAQVAGMSSALSYVHSCGTLPP